MHISHSKLDLFGSSSQQGAKLLSQNVSMRKLLCLERLLFV